VFATTAVRLLLPVSALVCLGSMPACCRIGTPHSGPIRIMPLGDSITNGTGEQSGYRNKLYHDLMAIGLKVDFVGSLRTNGCDSLEDLDHEGHPGFRINNLVNGWGAYKGLASVLGPGVGDVDIILLMIGTNDVSKQQNFAHVGDRLSGMLTLICDKDTGLKPNAHVMVAKVPPRADADDDRRTRWYNAEVERVVSEHITKGQKLSLVDAYTPLNVSDLADGVHPTQSGYDKISDVWLEGIRTLIH